MPANLRPKHASRRRGFTLLEMMLVLLIIGLLATVAALNLTSGADKARVQTTQASIRSMETALKSYYFEKGAYPTTAEGLLPLVPKFLEEVPTDGWKRPFQYYSPGTSGHEFEIISLGKDALPNTEDDVVSWKIE